MATMSWDDYYKRRDLWIKIITTLVIVIMGLISLSIVLGVGAYHNANAKETLESEIITLQADNKQKIKAWKEEREAFIEHYNYKGRLSKRHARSLDVYNEKIKRIEYQNEGIHLLEKQLSRP